MKSMLTIYDTFFLNLTLKLDFLFNLKGFKICGVSLSDSIRVVASSEREYHSDLTLKGRLHKKRK